MAKKLVWRRTEYSVCSTLEPIPSQKPIADFEFFPLAPTKK